MSENPLDLSPEGLAEKAKKGFFDYLWGMVSGIGSFLMMPLLLVGMVGLFVTEPLAQIIDATLGEEWGNKFRGFMVQVKSYVNEFIQDWGLGDGFTITEEEKRKLTVTALETPATLRDPIKTGLEKAGVPAEMANAIATAMVPEGGNDELKKFLLNLKINGEAFNVLDHQDALKNPAVLAEFVRQCPETMLNIVRAAKTTGQASTALMNNPLLQNVLSELGDLSAFQNQQWFKELTQQVQPPAPPQQAPQGAATDAPAASAPPPAQDAQSPADMTTLMNAIKDYLRENDSLTSFFGVEMAAGEYLDLNRIGTIQNLQEKARELLNYLANDPGGKKIAQGLADNANTKDLFAFALEGAQFNGKTAEQAIDDALTNAEILSSLNITLDANGALTEASRSQIATALDGTLQAQRVAAAPPADPTPFAPGCDPSKSGWMGSLPAYCTSRS